MVLNLGESVQSSESRGRTTEPSPHHILCSVSGVLPVSEGHSKVLGEEARRQRFKPTKGKERMATEPAKQNNSNWEILKANKNSGGKES